MINSQPLMLPVPTVIMEAEAKAAAKAAMTRKKLVDGQCVVPPMYTRELGAHMTIIAMT